MKPIILLFSLIVTNAVAYDGLGNYMTNKNNDNSQRAQIAQKQATNTTYSTSTTTEPNGLVINQYTDSTGRIFAITWSGPVNPNLENLLGNYFTVYKNPQNIVSNPGHTNLEVSNGDLVVTNTGHMRAFKGKAYLKSLLPQDFDLNTMQ